MVERALHSPKGEAVRSDRLCGGDGMNCEPPSSPGLMGSSSSAPHAQSQRPGRSCWVPWVIGFQVRNREALGQGVRSQRYVSVAPVKMKFQKNMNKLGFTLTLTLNPEPYKRE